MPILRQSTAATVQIGPFLDSTNGSTPETALTLAPADVLLAKNGAALAAKSSATTSAHDDDGWYACLLDTTDTGTLGRLNLSVQEAGALPVWHNYAVVTANVYDSLFSTDKLQVDAVEIDSTAQRATDLAELAQFLIATTCTLTDKVADGSVLAQIMARGGDVSDYSSNDHSLEEQTVLHDTTQGLLSSIPTAAEITDAVWDEAVGDHVTAGTTGKAVSLIAGAGASAKTVKVTLTGSGAAVPNCDVWLTSDVAGTDVVAGAQSTNDSGIVTFYVDIGTTYYVWVNKAGSYSYTNPINTWTPS